MGVSGIEWRASKGEQGLSQGRKDPHVGASLALSTLFLIVFRKKKALGAREMSRGASKRPRGDALARRRRPLCGLRRTQRAEC